MQLSDRARRALFGEPAFSWEPGSNVVDSAVHVECFGRRPCWEGWKGMCVSILGSICFSSVLVAAHSRLIGRQILPMLLSLPGFRIGMIIALCHISGMCSVEMDRLKMLVRQLMAPWASFLRWRVLILSRPMAEGDLASRIASFVSAGVKDGIPVNDCWWNCRLSCLLDISPVSRIGGGVFVDGRIY